ncbi:MAG: phospho-sugar mutase [Chlamydiia bacterium]|nr:phospho-sugar mutase [Chlamydiia bacterium]
MKKLDETLLDRTVEKNLSIWQQADLDAETQTELLHLQADPERLTDAFYRRLAFGTGGLRGIVGVGSNRMNRYTIAQATQGLANYLKKTITTMPVSVIIGYDSRPHSRPFAEQTARVLAGNGIQVFIYSELRPTPLVSFGCRYKQCAAAVMITASHNPPEYNGYKVYWSDGGQVLPPHDQGIITEVNAIEGFGNIREASLDSPLIVWIDDSIDQAYLKAMDKLQQLPTVNQDRGGELRVIYSSLHGTGITIIPALLKRWGFTSCELVEAQCKIDGTFPTVKFPNPEEPAALELGTRQLVETGADLLLATDPDADRVGVVVAHQGTAVRLTGNEVASLCLAHLCSCMEKSKGNFADWGCVKTIVTTQLFRAIADQHNLYCCDVLTGFKYIAEVIQRWEESAEHRFLFGGEESYGYLMGSDVRDKDAGIASALICEMALQAKIAGQTLVDQLYALYKEYGVYREALKSLKFPDTKSGHEQMKTALKNLRANPPTALVGADVLEIADYSISIRRCLRTGDESQIDLPRSDVLAFKLANGGSVVVRPSGTEPKVKIYVESIRKADSPVEETIAVCDAENQRLIKELSAVLGV